MKTVLYQLFIPALVLLCGCGSIKVTGNGKTYPATYPGDVQILKIKPDRHFEELGDVSATDWPESKLPQMLEHLKAQAAKLGANAVFISSEGVTRHDFTNFRWATGSAIRWKD